MASHDAIPNGTFAVGTTLFECNARVGEVVITRAEGMFRAARVIGIERGRALVVCPSLHPGGLPLRFFRDCAELYALVGARVAGIVEARETEHQGHTLPTSAGGQ